MDTKTNYTSIPYRPLVTAALLRIFHAMNNAVICQAAVLFGTVSNVVNIVVFLKLGFKDSINISLFGLAVSDLCACLTLVWRNICYNPWFYDLDSLPFDPIHLAYLPSGGLHVMFTKITGAITGFVTLERCLCVMMPLRVKEIVTRRKVIITIISFYVVFIVGYAPTFYVNGYGTILSLQWNKTVIGLVFAPERNEIERYFEPVYHILVPIVTFLFVIVCTVLLISSLKKQAKWRERATVAAGSSEASTKEKKIAAMVASISCLFIACFLPTVLIIVGMELDPEFSIDGKRSNLWDVLFSYSFIFETINSSMNIIIYYHQNTNYRNALRHICGARQNK